MSKKYLRKIHFSEDEAWTYYTTFDGAVIFSPTKERFERILPLETGEYEITPSIVKRYIEEYLR